jgi:hypothetical protein
MTEIKLKRFASNSDATLGMILIDDGFLCFTLEDEKRLVKLAGETRIPAGRYEITRCYQSGILSRMQEKWYKGSWIPSIENVPGFTYIRIHTGNTDDHTNGCPLVGMTANSEHYTIGESRTAYLKLIKALDAFFAAGERVFITIEDD